MEGPIPFVYTEEAYLESADEPTYAEYPDHGSNYDTFGGANY